MEGRNRGGGPLPRSWEMGVQITEGGLWGRSTNATLRLHGRLQRDAADSRGTGWEKGLLAENQNPDRTPMSVQRFQPHRRWESTPQNLPTKGQP